MTQAEFEALVWASMSGVSSLTFLSREIRAGGKTLLI